MIDVYKVHTTVEPVAELLSLDTEVKPHLNITHTDDDVYLTALITSTRKRIEKLINKGIGQQTVTIEVDCNEPFNLPLNPVNTISEARISYDNGKTFSVVTGGYFIRANQFYPEISGYYKLIYTTGFDENTRELPEDIRLAWLNEIGYRYMNRGDIKASGDFNTETYHLLQPHIDLTWM